MQGHCHVLTQATSGALCLNAVVQIVDRRATQGCGVDPHPGNGQHEFLLSMAFSHDGLSLYIPSRVLRGLVHTSRNPATGQLTHIDTITLPSWGDPRSIVISPDDRFVFVFDNREYADEIIYQLDRADGVTGGGELTNIRPVGTAHRIVNAGLMPYHFAMSPDSAVMYALQQFGDCATGAVILGYWNYDAASGFVSPTPIHSECPVGREHAAFAVSPDGAHVYIVSRHGTARLQYSGAVEQVDSFNQYKNREFSLARWSLYNLTASPTVSPTVQPTSLPTTSPVTSRPTDAPTGNPTLSRFMPTTAPTPGPTISPTAPFVLTDCGARERGNIQSRTEAMTFLVNQTTTVVGYAGSDCPRRRDIFGGLVALRTPENISFGLEVDDLIDEDDYQLCVNDAHGRVTITPKMSAMGTHRATLFARDGTSSPRITIASWAMTVSAPTVVGDFGLVSSADLASERCASVFSRHEDRARAEIEAFQDQNVTRIAQGFEHMARTALNWTMDDCDVSSLFANYASDSAGLPVIKFETLVVIVNGTVESVADDDRPSVAVLHSSSTGKMSLTMAELGRHRVILQATTPRTGQAPVNLASVDVHVWIGPNGRGCGNMGEPVHTLDAANPSRNNTYTCDCGDSGWSGDNCETAAPATQSASSDGDDSVLTTVISAVLGAVVLILAAAAVAFRVQVYRIKHSPVDMEAYEEAVLASLGVDKGATTDIGPAEFGLRLLFGEELHFDELARGPGNTSRPNAGSHTARRRRGAKPSDHLELESTEWIQFRNELLSKLAKAGPQLLASATLQARVTGLSLSAAEASGAEARSRVLVVIKLPWLNSSSSTLPERAVGKLRKQIDKSTLIVRSKAIVAASLAVPRRIPRELHRKHLQRFRELGHGAFGVVELYEVNEHHRAVPAFKVAAKSVRPGQVAAGREELLREAALMALLDHRNVVRLVGLVTVPRDLPALVLLEFCDGGTLLDRVRGAAATGNGPISLVKQLTYCAQVLQAMEYISARQIVHRDLACRNVLLSSTGVCKLADFGMSVSLALDDKNYSAQYVRIQEEIALRWAAPEALQHQKFSRASDCWAFGVLCWEIFAHGIDPYSVEFQNLGEISAFVKGGGRLQKPAGCPEQVFDDLIKTCWATRPKSRPAFYVLYDIAVKCGAEEDQEALEESSDRRRDQHPKEGSSDDRSLLAPSVHFILNELPSLVTAASTKASPLAMHIDEATSYSVKDLVVVPTTKDQVCQRDRQLGAVFVDTLIGPDNVGMATAILSYAWRYPIVLIGGALNAWCETNRQNCNAKSSYVWLDVLCWNQHGRLSDPVAEWTPRVEKIGHQLTMLHPW